MRRVLNYLFGAEATLKRETVILVIWPGILLVLIRVFVFAPPEHVANYQGVLTAALWPLIIFGGSIFGIQIFMPIPGVQRQSTTVVSETVTEPAAATTAAERPYQPPANGA